ncbi:hypothetical protein N7486_009249 [Penicillium sp. IBT 16267x]|nr:hypothetical protein N7486_009249 [Penicillium sp. IBT 16267x]
MNQDDESLPGGGQDTGAELPLKFRLDRRLVVAKKAELLDIRWPTVCRLELTQPLFLTLIQPIGALCPWIKARWPEWFLPPTVILKKQKVGWKDEFVTEIEAYKLLKPIQGTVVPYFYGEAVYDGSPALVFSAITGSNLVDLARNKFPESKDQALQKSLEDALKALTSYGVEYRDERLDNFLWADGERAMIIDLEQVKFGTTKVWERSDNRATPNSLMREFRRTRDPDRAPRYDIDPWSHLPE